MQHFLRLTYRFASSKGRLQLPNRHIRRRWVGCFRCVRRDVACMENEGFNVFLVAREDGAAGFCEAFRSRDRPTNERTSSHPISEATEVMSSSCGYAQCL